MKFLTTLSIALVLATALCTAPLLAAQASVTLPDAPAGTLVVTGRVASLEARWDGATGTIHTYVALDVARVLLGSGVPARIVIEQLGGAVGGVGLWLPDQAVFQVGEDVLVVLTSSPGDATLHTVGFGRGKWSLDTSAIKAAVPAGPGSPGGVPSPSISVAEAERALAATRHQALAAFVAVPPEFGTFAPPDAPGFTFLPTGDLPARWHEVDDNLAVPVRHPTAVPGTWTGGSSPANATAAINLWRASGMDLNLTDGGNTFPTAQCSATFTGDGRIAVSYNDPCGGVSDWTVGGGYYTTGDRRTVNGIEFQKFIQGFVILGSAGPQTTAAGCFQDAVAHGLGHALGLGHTSAAGSMMEPAPRSNCAAGPGTLGADDLAGITTIYQGIASGPFPPDAPVNFTVSAVLNSVTMSWTPAASGGVAQRYLVDAGTAPGVYNLGSLPFPGSTTSTSVAGVPVGTYYLRVRAQNAIGTSPPSLERSVTLGACAPPGPPGALSGSAVDTAVSLQWSAPASGVAQGYRLSVGSAPGLANLAVLDVPAAPTSFAANAPYGSYFVRVQATNVCGVSAPSNEITLLVQPCTAPPQAPTGLTFSRVGSNVALAWTAPAGTPPTSYTVVAGSAPGLSNLAVIPTGSTATSLGGPVAAGTYYVRVLAQNACGPSGASNEIVLVVP